MGVRIIPMGVCIILMGVHIILMGVCIILLVVRIILMGVCIILRNGFGNCSVMDNIAPHSLLQGMRF
jgi:hypothetical protein